MAIEKVRYLDHGAILATIDGVEMCVPDDPDNRHRRALADWERAGNTIAPCAVSPAVLPPLQARQIRLALLDIGKLADVDKAIDALPEPMRSQVSIEWEYGTEFYRDKPTTKQLAAAIGLTDAQTDALWLRFATV